MRRRRAGAVAGVVVAVLLALLTGATAGASPLLQDTDTPTATLTPTGTPSPTVTGVSFGYATQQTRAPGPDSFSCPVTPPVGWRTITPAAAWSILCGQCLASDGSWLVPATATLVPSATIYRTSTLGPSPTGGPSPTATVTRTPTITQTPTKTLTPTAAYYSQPYIPPNAQFLTISPGGGINYKHWVWIDAGVGNTFQVVGGTTSASWSFACHVAGADVANVQVCTSSNGSTCAGTSRISEGCGALGLRDRSETKVTTATGNDGPNRYIGVRHEYTGASGQAGIYALTINNVRMQWGIPTATPTPAASPTPANEYCGTVDGGAEDDFSYSGIIFGASECMDIGPVDITIPLIGWHIDIPWIAHLCLQGVTLGLLTVFGMAIALDAIVIAFGVVAIIRLLT